MDTREKLNTNDGGFDDLQAIQAEHVLENDLDEEDWEIVESVSRNNDVHHISLFNNDDDVDDDVYDRNVQRDDFSESSEDVDSGEPDDRISTIALVRHVFGTDTSLLDVCLKGDYTNLNKNSASRLPRTEVVVNRPTSYPLEPEPELLLKRFQVRPRIVPDPVIAAEAEWLTSKLQSHIESLPIQFYRTKSAKTKFNNYLEFPLQSIFDEKLQRTRYQDVFSKSGTPSSDNTDGVKYDFFPISVSIRQNVLEATTQFLKHLLNDRYDIPYIIFHKGHYICPPLTEEICYLYFAWDVQYWNVKLQRSSYHQVIQSFGQRLSQSAVDSLSLVINNTDNPLVLQHIGSLLSSAANHKISHHQSVSSPEEEQPKTASKTVGRPSRSASASQLFSKRLDEFRIRDKYRKSFLSPYDQYNTLINLFTLIPRTGQFDYATAEHFVSHIQRPSAPEELLNLTGQDSHENAVLNYISNLSSACGYEIPQGLKSNVYNLLVEAEAIEWGSNPILVSCVHDYVMNVSALSTASCSKQSTIGRKNWLDSQLTAAPYSTFTCNSISQSLLNSIMNDVNNEYGYLKQYDEASTFLDKKRIALNIEQYLNYNKELLLSIDSAAQSNRIHLLQHPSTNGEIEAFKEAVPEAANLDSIIEASKNDCLLIHSLVSALIMVFTDAPFTEIDSRKYSQPWSNFISDIIIKAMEKFILPASKKLIHNYYIQKSRDYLSQLYQRRFEILAMPSPVRLAPALNPSDANVDYFFSSRFPNFTEINDPVLEQGKFSNYGKSAIYEPDDYQSGKFNTSIVDVVSTKSTPTCISMQISDDNGNLIIIRSYEYGLYEKTETIENVAEALGISKKKSRHPNAVNYDRVLAKLRSYLLSHETRPNIVVVPVYNNDAIALYEEVMNISSSVDHMLLNWQTYLIDANAIARATKETLRLPDNVKPNLYVIRGLAAIRYVMYPALELANQRPNLAELQLLQSQSCIGINVIEGIIDTILSKYLNRYGVYINRAIMFDHWVSGLQYCCGLGPVSAEFILKNVVLPLDETSILADNAVIPDAIYNMSSSFMKICPTDDDTLNCNYLDNCLLEPLNEIQKAHEMMEACDNETENDNSRVVSILQNKRSLDDLDLEQYAYLLIQTGWIRSLPLLERIKDELVFPFNSRAIITAGLDMYSSQLSIIGSQYSMWPGSEVNISQSHGLVNNRGLGNNNAPGFGSGNRTTTYIKNTDIELELLTGSNSTDVSRAYVIGWNNINSRFAALTPGSEELVAIFDSFGLHKHFPVMALSQSIYADIDGAVNNVANTCPVKPSRSRSIGKLVDHEGISSLSHASILHKFRGSKAFDDFKSRTLVNIRDGKNSLVLYLNILPNPFKYRTVHIEESEKFTTGETTKPVPLLTISGKEFSSISELFHTVCYDFLRYCDEITRHDHFVASESLDDVVPTLIPATGGSAKWCVMFDTRKDLRYKIEERFLILTVSIRGNGEHTVVKDTIQVSYKGYYILGKTFTNFRASINWYKSEGYANRRKLLQAFEISTAAHTTDQQEQKAVPQAPKPVPKLQIDINENENPFDL